VVFDEAGTGDELVREVTGVLAGLGARRFGRQSVSRRAGRAVAVATGGESR